MVHQLLKDSSKSTALPHFQRTLSDAAGLEFEKRETLLPQPVWGLHRGGLSTDSSIPIQKWS
jgi:hypothetical protein